MLEDLLYNYLFSITDGPTKVSRLLHDLWLGASLHTKKWESNLNSNQESHICSLALRNDKQIIWKNVGVISKLQLNHILQQQKFQPLVKI